MVNEILNRKIFLTDAEFAELFGPQIACLVKIMNKTAEDVCPPCDGYCCKNIHCVFYYEKFSTCPIFDIRPRECRYHFCNDVFTRAPLTKEEKDQMQQPVEELVCGDRGETAKLFFLFPEFPLDEKGPFGLEAAGAVEKIRDDFNKGAIDEKTAFSRIRSLCRG
jgi:hypothetical protein